MKNELTPIGMFLCILILACNPECDNLYNIRVDSVIKQQGQEMLIMSDNISALQGSEIQFIDGGQTITAKSKNMSSMGLIIEVPENIQGENVQMLINDPDCGLAIFGSTLTVGSADFFANSPDFIPPAPFEFVIPTPPTVFPPLVRDAWISPQNTDYCVWLRFHPETNAANEIIYTEVNGQMEPKESISVNGARSFEFSVQELLCNGGNPADLNGDCPKPPETYYHCNKVDGIVDKENNFVHLWIDRTNVNGENLGIEEFVGEFINISDAGYDNQDVPECGKSAWDPSKAYLMLITSQNSGRQLLLYQQGTL